MPRADHRVAALRDALKHRDRTLSGTSTPETHSSLAADDAVCPVLPCSHLAWTALGHGHRALAAAAESLDSSRAISTHDILVQLRLALVQTSHALTVLAPSRTSRTQYGLRLAWTALSGAGDQSPGLATLAPFVSPIAAEEVARLLVQRNFRASPRWSDASSVRIAGALVADHLPDPVLYADTARFLWNATEAETLLRDDLVTSAEILLGALDRAVDLWATRRLAPAGPTGPAPTGPLGQMPTSPTSPELVSRSV